MAADRVGTVEESVAFGVTESFEELLLGLEYLGGLDKLDAGECLAAEMDRVLELLGTQCVEDLLLALVKRDARQEHTDGMHDREFVTDVDRQNLGQERAGHRDLEAADLARDELVTQGLHVGVAPTPVPTVRRNGSLDNFGAELKRTQCS